MRPALKPPQARGSKRLHLFALRIQRILRGRFGQRHDLRGDVIRNRYGLVRVAWIAIRFACQRLAPDLLAYVALVAQDAGPEIVQHAVTELLHASETAAGPLARIVPHRPATGADLLLQLLQLAQQRRRIDIFAGSRRCFGRAEVEVAAAVQPGVEHRMAYFHVGDRTLLDLLSVTVFLALQLLRLPFELWRVYC